VERHTLGLINKPYQTLSYNWKKYVDSNYTDNIISNAYSRTEAHNFVESVIDYFDNKITIDFNDKLYKSLQSYLLHILRRCPDAFSKLMNKYYGPFPKILTTINLSSYSLDTVDMLLTRFITKFAPLLEIDELLTELDIYTYALYAEDKNHCEEYIKQYVEILTTDSSWKNKPQSLEIDKIKR
jgi:hypothetical protein